jgi:tetratricopeptide (TPR) repeat protein
LETARDILTGLTGEFPGNAGHRRRLAEARRTLGAVLVAQGRATEARAEFEAARDLLTDLTRQSDGLDLRRDLARTHTGLGAALRTLGEPDRAGEEFERARDIWRKLVVALPDSARQELAITHNHLGNLLADRGRHDEALKEYELARDHFLALVHERPDEPDVAMCLAQVHYNRGLADKQLDRFDAALGEYKQAATLQQRTADRFPSVPRYRRALAATYNAIGICAKATKRWDEARTAYEATIDVHRQLTDEFPTAYAYKQGLARAHNNLGGVAYAVGDWKEADAQYRAARDLHEQLVADFGLAESRRELASTHHNIGNLTRDTNRPDESLKWYGSAIGILQALREADPSNADTTGLLRDAHFHRGEAYKRLGKYARAVSDFDRAVELTPSPWRGRVRAYRAEVLLRTGRVADAVAEADDLTAAGDPDSPGAAQWEMELWYNFACIYAVASGAVPDKKGEYGGRAVRLLQKAVAAGFADAAHLARDADLTPLRDRDDFRQLLAKLETQSAKQGAPAPRRK